MFGIRTRYVPLSELPLTALRLANWLSSEELGIQMTMRSPERRRSWLAGRIVAKQLLRDLLAEQNHPLAVATANRIHIVSRCPRSGHGERPIVFIDSRRLEFAMSIAHTNYAVLAAARLNNEFTLGVDLVPSQPSADKLTWTFTDAERSWLASVGSEPGQAQQLWAMKEALYKACQQGEGFSPRAIEVVPGKPPRYLRSDTAAELTRLQCWRIDGQWAALAVVRNTRACPPSSDQPTQTAHAA